MCLRGISKSSKGLYVVRSDSKPSDDRERADDTQCHHVSRFFACGIRSRFLEATPCDKSDCHYRKDIGPYLIDRQSFFHNLFLVTTVGFEPTRPREHHPLKMASLPFLHVAFF